ncbi:acyl carrier protein [Modicisalibacter ilicicola DSM 19980]|uniref:Acyl carrier protein n=2 Tax=Modicisalibacter ilicicola TaxID=480814 RepID=A0A1M4ZYQ0_9GAMM|nr:acyl carrier protein [Halomonas ilicicola DSM 19980]
MDIVADLVVQIHPHHHAPENMTLDSRFEKELGLDSLARVELFSRIESAFNLTLPERTFAEAQTPRDLLRVLKTLKPSEVADFNVVAAQRHLGDAILPHGALTLGDLLEWHATRHGERTHIQFYQDDGNGETITYRQLHAGALKVADALQRHGLEAADPVAIMLPTGADYFHTFMGILLAGGIPVPIYPPARPTQLEEHVRRHTHILENCRARILVTLAEGEPVGRLLMSLVPGLKHILTASELSRSTGNATLPALKAQDIAFLQYTSGSTGNPKGVILTHANLLANIRAMGVATETSPRDVFVSWLPLYHDMGLIGAWLGSLYHAALFVVMSPLAFLARPERWLRAIERYGGTLSASPNFGYEYVLHRLQHSDLEGLDLSSWRLAFNGAEAISPKTLEAFTERFGAHGFDKHAMTPVYGLAESSVGLTFPPPKRGVVSDTIERDTFLHRHKALPAADEHQALRFVSCGTPLAGHQIRVVDVAGNELPEREEGRLEFQGPSSTTGYYRAPEKTRELFDGEWLGTGDLAYIAKGELYLTGRIKDIIIRAGRNIYPEQLEKAIGDIVGIRKGGVAIFGSADPKTATERLIILAETRIEDADEKHRLRIRINEIAADLIGTPPDEIVLAPPGSVLKTSSGKIRRSASREAYEKGEIGKKRRMLIWQVSRLFLMGALPQLRRITGHLKASLFALYSWLIFLLLSPTVWLGVVATPGDNLRRKIIRASALFLAKSTRTPLNIKGAENLSSIPDTCVMVVNHASYIDGLVMSTVIDTPFRFVGKAELAGSWLIRLPLERLHAELVDRFDFTKSVSDAQRLCDVLKKGHRLLFFAEGTFTRIPGLRSFHLGAFKAAVDAKVPVIPIALRGTRSILRAGSWFPRHGAITVTIGEAIEPNPSIRGDDERRTWKEALSLRNKARDFILRHCGEPDLTQ